jgi:hypothetical protein
MPLSLASIDYDQLNSRQKENYNFLKVSSILADYGFMTMRLTDDWQGADFIAQHIAGEFLRVQLKSRLTFAKKYEHKGLYVAFPNDGFWYLYMHDELLDRVLIETKVGESESWREDGSYSFPSLSRAMLKTLEPYRIGSQSGQVRGASAS